MRFPAPIGEVDEVDVLVYCDGPVLFIGADAAGCHHIVVLAVDNSVEQVWLSAQLSHARRTEILQNRVDLHDAFRHAERGFVGELRVPRQQPSHEGELTWVACDELADAMLPEPGCYADIVQEQSETDALFDPKEKARATGRDVLIIHLLPANSNLHEVPLAVLGRAATGTQDLLNAIAAHGSGRQSNRGRTPKTAIRRAEFSAIATHAASFALELHSAGEQALLWNDTDADPVLSQFFHLLDAIGTEEQLRVALAGYSGSKAPSKLRDLLAAVAEPVPRIEFLWGSPAAEMSVTRVGFDIATARSARATIDQVTRADHTDFPVVGRVVAADSLGRTFKLIDAEDGTAFSGKVADGVVLEGIVIKRELYLATLRQTIESASSGDTTIKYQLQELECLGSEPDGPATLV